LDRTEYWEGHWPFKHVTREQITQEYDLLKHIQEQIRCFTVERRVRLKHNEHHKPGYRIHGWIDAALIGFLANSFGIHNRFYEPAVNLDFKVPLTKETLGELVVIEYSLIRFLDKRSERRILLGYDVKVSSLGIQLAYTARPLFYIGPNPEVFLPCEAHLAR
jgi:hypothetical protein